MFHSGRYREKSFTIIEMLIVIAIISILASMLMPALNRALGQARQASCTNNLRNLGASVLGYENDHSRMPPYLSQLYPDYDMPPQIFLCPADGFDGLGGSKPHWGDENRFPETNELPPGFNADYANPQLGLGNRAGDRDWEIAVYGDEREREPEYTVRFLGSEPKEPWEFRNQDLEGSSYMYEFSVAFIPWEWGQGNITWHDFKQQEVRDRGTRVPVIRCWYHTTPYFRPNDTVLNFAYDFGVYVSGIVNPFAWDDLD